MFITLGFMIGGRIVVVVAGGICSIATLCKCLSVTVMMLISLAIGS